MSTTLDSHFFKVKKDLTKDEYQLWVKTVRDRGHSNYNYSSYLEVSDDLTRIRAQIKLQMPDYGERKEVNEIVEFAKDKTDVTIRIEDDGYYPDDPDYSLELTGFERIKTEEERKLVKKVAALCEIGKAEKISKDKKAAIRKEKADKNKEIKAAKALLKEAGEL